MNREHTDRISQAEKLVLKGDYRGARALVRPMRSAERLDPGDQIRVQRILAMTGVDPVAIVVMALTLGTIVFLTVTYVF